MSNDANNTVDLYQFTYNAAGTGVRAMSEVDGGRVKSKSIRGWSFELERGGDGQVQAVERSQLQKGVSKTERFEDVDGDGLFEETFSSEAVTTAQAAVRADKARFSFNELGEVLSMQSLSKGRWKAERLDADEHLDRVTIDGEIYVVKTEVEDDGVEWSLFRDDNADGIWTEVAELESASAQDLVELVGLSAVLAQTVSVVG